MDTPETPAEQIQNLEGLAQSLANELNTVCEKLKILTRRVYGRQAWWARPEHYLQCSYDKEAERDLTALEARHQEMREERRKAMQKRSCDKNGE